MKDLVIDIAKALVDIPDEVTVREVEGEQVTVLELRVAPTDLGKVIGKQGRTARSIRTLLGSGWYEVEPALHVGNFGIGRLDDGKLGRGRSHSPGTRPHR